MKKTIERLSVAFIVGSVLFVGCASSPKADLTQKVPVASASDQDKVVIVDWTDRTLGEIAAPTLFFRYWKDVAMLSILAANTPKSPPAFEN